MDGMKIFSGHNNRTWCLVGWRKGDAHSDVKHLQQSKTVALEVDLN